MSTPLDNWRWVPVEATEEMLAAGDKIMDCDPQWVRRGYMAMLAAAPHPPIAQPQAAGWRPIAEAPRDGTTVIVARHMGEFGWIRGCARWVGGTGFVAGWVSKGFDPVMGELGLAHPTHWQPLPEPPKEGA